jgi:hypothetical protein
MTTWRKPPTRSVTGTRASGSSECSVIGRLQAVAHAARIWQDQLKHLTLSVRKGRGSYSPNQEWTIDFMAECLPADSEHTVSNDLAGRKKKVIQTIRQPMEPEMEAQQEDNS